MGSNSDLPAVSKTKTDNSGLTAKISRSIFAGTDKNGIPTGFTVADASGNLGLIIVTSQSSNQLPDGFSLSSIAMATSANSLNVLLSQSITFNGLGVGYSATPSITINGAWFALDLTSIDATYTRLADGTYLISADFNVNSTAESAIYLEAKSGLSVGSIPSKLQTSIIVDSTKSRILAQAIFVNAKGVK